MPLTGNVIDVQKIQLTDTFQTWFAKTNEIVDALNPVNIYDIDNGAGTNVTYGVTGTAYNGVKYVNVNAGYGVAVGGGSAKPWTGVVGLDISSISGDAYTLTGNQAYTATAAAGGFLASEVNAFDWFVVQDLSDTTQGLSGTTKKVQARNMLPREIYMPTLDFWGDLRVKGALTVVGAAASTSVGQLTIASQFVYLATTGGGSSAGAFNTDSNLGRSGVIIAMTGGFPNKEFVWDYNGANSYWTFNTPFGVKEPNLPLVASKFISRNFAGGGTTANTFIFEAAGSTSTRMWLTENGVSPYFGIVKDAGSSNVNFNVYNGAGITSVAFIRAGATSQYTGVTANAFIQFANVDMVDGAHATTGASAWTIPVTDQFGEIYGERHNAGQIKRRFTQASHGLTTGQAVAIVITGAAVGVPGTITGADANSTSTEAFGIVDRVISTSEFSVTMKGYMDLSPNGLLGIGRPVTGQVYYLDWAVKGGLTTNTNVPQAKLYQPLFIALGASAGIVYGNEADVIFPYAQDQVYMRGMIPIGAIQPYAGGLAGLSLGLSGGSIPVSDVQYNSNWMPCDGRALSATGTSGFVDLFDLIGYTYSMRGVVTSSPNAADTVIRPDRGTANLGSLGLGSLAGVVRVIKRGAAGSDSPNIVKTYSYTGLTADGTTITLKGLTTQNSNIDANVLVDILSPKDGSYFFAPDLRGKAPFGEYAPYGARGEGFSLTAGATGGTATGDGGLFTNYLIRAKRDSDAMILTGHNHDSRYLRRDADSSAAVSTTLSLQNVEIAGILGNNDNIGIGMSPLSKSQGFTGFALSLNRSGDFGTWVSTYNGDNGANASAGYRANNAVGDGNLYLSSKSDCTFNLTTSDGCSGGIRLYTRGVTGPIRFSTNATERMRIDPTGNVGIGTSTPAAKLQTEAANNAARFGVSNVNALTIGRGGTQYSGIGYNVNFDSGSDGEKFFAVGADRTSLIRFNDGGFEFKGNTSNGAVSGTPFALTNYMTILKSGNVGIGTTTPTRKLHIVEGSNVPSGVADDGTITQAFAYPSLGGGVAYSGTLSNHAHALLTNNVQRLWITNAGYIGIGTNAPNAKLEIVGATAANAEALRVVAGTSSQVGVRLYEDSDGANFLRFRPLASPQTGFIFSDDADTPILTIQTLTDRVGIGTSTPAQALDVVGSIVASGAINASTLNVSGLSKLKRLSVFDGTTDVDSSFSISTQKTANNSGALIGYGTDTLTLYGIIGYLDQYSFYGRGDILSTGNITAFSDIRNKENISTIENGLSKTLTLNGVLYTDKETQERRTGLIAQDVLAVLPEAVHTTADGYYSLAYGNLVGLLVQAIKELNAKVDSLASKVETLSSGGK